VQERAYTQQPIYFKNKNIGEETETEKVKKATRNREKASK